MNDHITIWAYSIAIIHGQKEKRKLFHVCGFLEANNYNDAILKLEIAYKKFIGDYFIDVDSIVVKNAKIYSLVDYYNRKQILSIYET